MFYVHANFASELSRQPSAGCTCLAKPLQELSVTAVRAVAGNASLHFLYESDSSRAAPAYRHLCGGQPFTLKASMPTTLATASIAFPGG